MGNPTAKPKFPRRDDRYKTLGLSCPIGEIVDLSASGMRIRSTGKPSVTKGQANQFVLKSSRQKLTISGTVAWIRRQSLLSKQYEVGIRFSDSRGATRDALVAFAKYGFVGKNQHTTSNSSNARPSVARASIVVENHYKVLGIDRTANSQEIRRAYWVLAKTYHPDTNSDPSAEIRFRKINEAHEVLGDPAKRRGFDQILLAQMNAA